jgi:hypothetical protein
LTWWQQRYGSLSDPAFILPWRLDPEKGFGISEDAKRYQSKDILFDKDDPKPGDTVTITARVRNFSLLPTPVPVPVRFYVGDPDAGGIPIAGIHGETNLVTSIIPSRGTDSVKLQWVVPGGMPEYPRIYAILDPQDVIPEVHNENNKAFTVMGRQPTTVADVVEHFTTAPTEFRLFQSYPNPFNPSTTIKFSLPVDRFVSLKVYDMLGREVATLMSEEVHAGTYQREWDATRFASGVYYYRIAAGEYLDTKKTVLIK